MINLSRLPITSIPFSLFHKNQVSPRKPIGGGVQTRARYFSYPSTVCVTLPASAHSDPMPCPEGCAISVNGLEQLPRDDAAGICKEGRVQVMTQSLLHLGWPLSSSYSRTCCKVHMPSSLGSILDHTLSPLPPRWVSDEHRTNHLPLLWWDNCVFKALSPQLDLNASKEEDCDFIHFTSLTSAHNRCLVNVGWMTTH